MPSTVTVPDSMARDEAARTPTDMSRSVRAESDTVRSSLQDAAKREITEINNRERTFPARECERVNLPPPDFVNIIHNTAK